MNPLQLLKSYGWIVLLLGGGAAWLARDRAQQRQIGAQEVALASLDSSRQQWQRDRLAWQAQTARDSALAVSQRSQIHVLGIRADSLRSSVLAASSTVDSTVRHLADSIPALQGQLSAFQSAYDTLQVFAQVEHQARILAQAALARTSLALVAAQNLLARADSLQRRSAVSEKVLAKTAFKKPFPLGLGCAVGPAVSSAGFGPIGVSCGVTFRIL